LFTASCTSGGQSRKRKPDTGSIAPPPSCIPGSTCVCRDGREGKSTCDMEGVQSCDCSACPEFIPRSEEPWAPCGGQVLGLWRLKNVRYLGGAFIQRIGGGSGRCPADLQFSTDPRSLTFLIQFREDAAVDASDLELSTRAQFLTSCASQLAAPAFCEDLRILNANGCHDTCGICDCSYSQYIPGRNLLAWYNTDKQLNFLTRDDPLTFDYCVQGTRLLLHREWMEYELERQNAGGAPLACDLRTAETCEAGEGCHFGACVGASGCESYVNEPQCAFNKCTWRASGCGDAGGPDGSSTCCGGVAPKTCMAADYGNVPGCDFLWPPGSAMDAAPNDARDAQVDADS
jgi:hypothetical protein